MNARRRPRTDRLTSAWMLLALVAAAIAIAGRGTIPRTWWTTIHLVTLGVLTNGILQWSWFFARGLLHLPAADRRSGRDALVRSLAFNASLVGLIASMWTRAMVGVLVFATVIGAVVAWHGLAIARAMHGALGSRYATVMRFYVAAAALFVVGCALAGTLTIARAAPHAWEWAGTHTDQLALAHALVMVCGWLGLSMAGTIVTLGPTMLRTTIDAVAARWALAALPWLVAAILASATAALVSWWPLAGAALGAYGVGLAAAIVAPVARSAATKGPRDHATWNMTCGIAWAGIGLAVVALGIARAADAGEARDAAVAWVAVIGAGGLAQIFVGALTYLLPVVVGGGPAAVRSGIAALEWLSPARLAARNTAILLLAVTTGIGSSMRWAWWAIVVATFVADVAIMGRAGAVQGRARRTAMAPS